MKTAIKISVICAIVGTVANACGIILSIINNNLSATLAWIAAFCWSNNSLFVCLSTLKDINHSTTSTNIHPLSS